jgi:uncharacterized protein YjbI with pentapeptide repeats
MKVIKPSQLGVLARPYEIRGEFRLSVSILALIPLGDVRALLPEIALWPMAAEQLGDEPVLDAALPKARAEYLLAGRAYALGGSGTTVTASAMVAGRRKMLRVFGDRYFKADWISEPKTFDSMPLDWAHAFGGKQFPKNPLGRGLEATLLGSETVTWLPNVERPETLIRGPMDRPEPGSFRAIDASWPERASKAGTYDATWLREDFPGFARDMDPSYFNLAPSDQQFDQTFAHDTPYELQNLHPTRTVIAGKLPSVRARCFINRDPASFQAVEEVTARLNTVWFFPSVERAVLVFQGSVITRDDDASDVTHLMVAAEEWDVGLPIEHYREVITGRCDRKIGHLRILKDSELCALALTAADPAAAAEKAEMEGEGLAQKRLLVKQRNEFEKWRGVVASYGLDPDLHGPVAPPPTPPPTLEELPAFIEQMQAEAERQKEEARISGAKRDEENAALFAKLGLDYEVVRAELARKTVGPQIFSARGKIADIQAVVDDFSRKGLPTEHIRAIIEDPEQLRTWEEAERQSREAYRASAHMQDPASPRDPAESVSLLGSLTADGAKRFAGLDLTGADLSKASLAGADFQGAFMESTNLSGADLKGANLSGAVLAHANLEGADLSGADLRGANLGSSRLDSANLTGCKLERAVLAKASLVQARFDRAELKQTDFGEATFDRTSFAGTIGSQTTFLKSAMKDLSFEGASFKGCNFIEVDLSAARFRDADLSTSVFLHVIGSKADFTNAKLKNARFCEAPTFAGAVFSGADLSDANLRGVDLQGANFRGATLNGADLSQAKAANADFYRASAKNARFVKADLVDAKFVATNLMGASLAGAHLEGTDFTGSNLFGADLSRVAVDHRTRSTDALTVNTRIQPARQGTYGFRR